MQSSQTESVCALANTPNRETRRVNPVTPIRVFEWPVSASSSACGQANWNFQFRQRARQRHAETPNRKSLSKGRCIAFFPRQTLRLNFEHFHAIRPTDRILPNAAAPACARQPCFTSKLPAFEPSRSSKWLNSSASTKRPLPRPKRISAS